jgi:enamine deaminase RidA (YjgF/YER057c/UK114 family)
MSQAVRAGNLIYVSGQLATDTAGALVGENDCGAQARQCFHNVERVLSELGAGLGDVVHVTAYMSRAEDVDAYRTVRAELFEQNPPACTTVLASPVRPQYLLEVQVVAVSPA